MLAIDEGGSGPGARSSVSELAPRAPRSRGWPFARLGRTFRHRGDARDRGPPLARSCLSSARGQRARPEGTGIIGSAPAAGDRVRCFLSVKANCVLPSSTVSRCRERGSRPALAAK